MSGEKPRIGVPQSGYAVDRNVRVLGEYVTYIRPWDFWRVMNALTYRIKGHNNMKYQFTFSQYSYPSVDALHLRNAVSLTRTPWVSSFETSLPRWGNSPEKRGLEALLRDEARCFIAQSEATKQIFLERVSRNTSTFEIDTIASKTIVLHPPQSINLPSERMPPNSRPSRNGLRKFCFVGTDFYRKGGHEMLKVFENLFDSGHKDWFLTIVGDLDSYGDFASRTNGLHKEHALRIINKLRKHVTLSNRLPKDQITDLFRKSDFLLFPTIQDTYGYVTLEAMSNGCVPIVSNQRAIPEIVQQFRNGLMFEIPLTSQFSAVDFYQSSKGPEIFAEALFDKISEALHMPGDTWSMLSQNAINSIRERHDPLTHQKQLLKIYKKAGFFDSMNH